MHMHIHRKYQGRITEYSHHSPQANVVKAISQSREIFPTRNFRKFIKILKFWTVVAPKLRLCELLVELTQLSGKNAEQTRIYAYHVREVRWTLYSP